MAIAARALHTVEQAVKEALVPVPPRHLQLLTVKSRLTVLAAAQKATHARAALMATVAPGI
jgi:hypothetical protein